jgi:23S rRNA pseudouridine955/2504/2580 synthase
MSVQIITVTDDEADLRLDRWFRRHFPTLAHSLLEKWLRGGNVRVAGKRAKSNQRLISGEEIRVPPLPEGAPPRPAEPRPVLVDEQTTRMLHRAILYKDDDVIVLDKPPGLAVQGGTGMADNHLDAMLDALRFGSAERPKLVHRLDKDTSGVLLIGRTASATSKLAASFKSRAARKCYWALVAGVPKIRQGRIDAPLAKMSGHMGDKVQVDDDEGKRAVTYYRIVENVLRRAAWLELEPRTGRTHQLRAHCALLNTPILGDGKYGAKEAFIEGHGISRKLHLHARAIRIPHPKGGILEVMAPLPAHIAASFAFFGFSETAAGKAFTAFDED